MECPGCGVLLCPAGSRLVPYTNAIRLQALISHGATMAAAPARPRARPGPRDNYYRQTLWKIFSKRKRLFDPGTLESYQASNVQTRARAGVATVLRRRRHGRSNTICLSNGRAGKHSQGFQTMPEMGVR